MPLPLFQEWLAYNELDPIGSGRGDWRAAMVACTISNAMRGKRGRRAKVRDFMPKFGPVGIRKQSIASMRANLNAMTADFAANKNKPRKRKCRQ